MWVVEWAERVGSDKGLMFLFTLILAISLALFLWGWLMPWLRTNEDEKRKEREDDRKHQEDLLKEQATERAEQREERKEDRTELKRLYQELVEINMRNTEALNASVQVGKQAADAVEANNELRRDNNEIHSKLQNGVDEIKKDMKVLSDNVSGWNRESAKAYTNIERKLDEMAQPKNA